MPDLGTVALVMGTLAGLVVGDLAITLQRNLPSYSQNIKDLNYEVDTSVSYLVPRDADGNPAPKKSWIPIYGAFIDDDKDRLNGILWAFFMSLLLLTRKTGIVSMIERWSPASMIIGAMIVTASAAIMILTVASIDMKYKIIPNQANLIIFVLSSAFFALKALNGTWIVSAKFELAIMGFIAVIMLLSSFIPGGKGIGMGDVKTIVALTPMLGASTIVMLLVSSISSALFSLYLLLSHRDDWRHTPFGPFLAYGCLVALISNEAFAKLMSTLTMGS